MTKSRNLIPSLFLLSLVPLSGCAPEQKPIPATSGASTQQELQGAQEFPAVDPEVDFIVGGVRVNGKTDYVSRSTVGLVARESEGVAICSGTLIAPDVILTAGHCVASGARRMLAVFSHSLSRAEGHVVEVDAVARPADYALDRPHREDRDLNDIALVKLSSAAPAPYQVAELPPAGFQLKNSTPLVLAGYGIVHGQNEGSRGNAGAGTLRKVTVRVEDANYGKSEILIDQSQGRGACHGDSGGPAYIHSAGKVTVVGVTSRGLSNEPDDCLHHSVYSSVAAHLDWIQKTMTQLRSR